MDELQFPEGERTYERDAVWLGGSVFRVGRHRVDVAVAAHRKIYDNRAELAARVGELRAAL